MALTDTEVKAAKPRKKAFKMYDGGGLFMFIPPTGAKLWRLRYRGLHSKEKVLALGSYPLITLKRAREKRDDALRLLDRGIDPSAHKKAARTAAADTFAALAAEYLDLKRKTLNPKTIAKAEWLLDDWINKYIGDTPVAQLEPGAVLSVCRRLEAKGFRESAHRALSLVSRICRYGIPSGRCKSDPCRDLRGQLVTVETKNHASITEPAKLGGLLRAIDDYDGQPSTKYALKLAPLLFVRPGELRAAEWSEFDLDTDEPVWRIPASRMKMKVQHLVPLARQAVDLLNELRPLTGDGRLLFPSLRSSDRPISDNTLNAALRRLGYSGEQHVAHGFRSTASTRLHEMQWNHDWIERQLAHGDRDKVSAAYNYAQYLPERRRMMQAWADYLDGLKAGGKVVAIRRKAAKS
jgi:integrase